MVKLFDVKGGVIVPTEHCYTLSTLSDIMEAYREDEEYLKVYEYLFYMTCPNPDLNPFFDVRDSDKEALIIEQISPMFSLEDELVINGLEFCEKLYDTPTARAYNGIKKMLDKLASYMGTTEISHGRDGNITAMVNAAAKFDQVRNSFKGAYKDLEAEQNNTGRGGQQLAYDQKKRT